MVTEPQRPLVAAEREGQQAVENGLADDTSWIAEDADPVGVASGRGQGIDPVGVASGQGQGITEHLVRREENPAFRPPPSHALSPSLFQPRTNPGLRSRPLLTSTPQLSPVNEADEQGYPRHDNYHNDNRGHRSNIPSRLIQPPRLQSIPEQSPYHSSKSVFHTTPSALVTVDGWHG